MRLILLVLLFLIWETWTPESARMVLLSPVVGLSLFLSGYCLLIIGMRWWANRLANGAVRGDLGREIGRFNLGMNAARFLIPIWFAVGVFTLNWHQVVDALLRPLQRSPRDGRPER